MSTISNALPRFATHYTPNYPIIELAADMPRSINRIGQTIRVISGMAWVTMDGEDYFIEPGETLNLLPGRSHAVIEGMKHKPVVFQTERN